MSLLHTDNVHISDAEIEALAGEPLAIQELESDNDFSESEESGFEALYTVAMGGQVSTVRRALEMGADISAKDREGLTALHMAAAYGHEEVVK